MSLSAGSMLFLTSDFMTSGKFFIFANIRFEFTAELSAMNLASYHASSTIMRDDRISQSIGAWQSFARTTTILSEVCREMTIAVRLLHSFLWKSMYINSMLSLQVPWEALWFLPLSGSSPSLEHRSTY